jgi:hypothetical protein
VTDAPSGALEPAATSDATAVAACCATGRTYEYCSVTNLRLAIDSVSS